MVMLLSIPIILGSILSIFATKIASWCSSSYSSSLSSIKIYRDSINKLYTTPNKIHSNSVINTQPNTISQSNQSQLKTSDVFSLESIRSTLIRQEETIIFALIERAQFRSNQIIYQPSALNFKDDNKENISFFDWMLLETEKLHAQVRRYTSPEEHPFNPQSIPKQVIRLPKLNYPSLLGTEKEKVNVNGDIKQWYIDRIIPRLCEHGDDEQYGSSVMADIAVVQAISRRVHYGKFVAESKYLKEGDLFKKFILNGDIQNIINLLTNIEVERRVLRRAFIKASTYGQDIIYEAITTTSNIIPDSSSSSSNSNNNNTPIHHPGQVGYKVDPKLIVEIYRDMIIPLTKDVEVRYLFHRVGMDPPPSKTYFESCRGPMDAFDDPNALKQLKIN